MKKLVHILSHWIADPTSATIHPLKHAGFSGSRVVQIDFAGRQFALKLWPANQPAERLRGIHLFQRFLARGGVPVPAPVAASATGQTLVTAGKGVWELAPWMPGAADYWSDPQPAKLEAALRTLAQIHQIAATFITGHSKLLKTFDLSRALQNRSHRLHNLQFTGLEKLRREARDIQRREESEQAAEALSLIERILDVEVQKSVRWRDEPLPLHWCLRDVWHDHVLFTGTEVTGLIDFGATAFDAPAGDVAHLLGSLVGDDPEGWRRGLAAYETVRPLSETERQSVAFFDTSGTLLSAANWIRWLAFDGGDLWLHFDRTAALGRLQRLNERLRNLAEGGRPPHLAEYAPLPAT